MTESTPMARFAEAGVEWAAGGGGQPLVDAAAVALAEGLDSPSLRVLAGAPRRFADDEAQELAPVVFAELGISIERRLTPSAIVRGSQLLATRFLASADPNPRGLARQLYFMSVSADYPSELDFWLGADDSYSLLDEGIYSWSEESLDRAVVKAAQALADGDPPPDTGC